MLGIHISPLILNSKAYMEIKMEFLQKFDDAEFVRKFRFFKVFVDQKIGFRCGSFSGTKNKLFFETCDGMFVGKYG